MASVCSHVPATSVRAQTAGPLNHHGCLPVHNSRADSRRLNLETVTGSRLKCDVIARNPREARRFKRNDGTAFDSCRAAPRRQRLAVLFSCLSVHLCYHLDLEEYVLRCIHIQQCGLSVRSSAVFGESQSWTSQLWHCSDTLNFQPTAVTVPVCAYIHSNLQQQLATTHVNSNWQSNPVSQALTHCGSATILFCFVCLFFLTDFQLVAYGGLSDVSQSYCVPVIQAHFKYVMGLILILLTHTNISMDTCDIQPTCGSKHAAMLLVCSNHLKLNHMPHAYKSRAVAHYAAEWNTSIFTQHA